MKMLPALSAPYSARTLGLALWVVSLVLILPLMAQAARVITAKDRTDSDALYQQAYAAYVASDYPRALSLLDRVDQLTPEKPDALNLRGIVCLRQSAYPQAEAAFAHAVALDPSLWAAQFNLAEIPFRQKNYARARSLFEKLSTQTNRFKERNQWELVQYKLILSCLLTGDSASAQKKLEKLPPTGGVTPAYQYAQVALAYGRKDSAAASKALESAHAAYNATLNNLFTEPLIAAGWISSPLTNSSALAISNMNMSTESRRNYPPASAYLDTRLEAAAAEPLPAPDGDGLPMLPPALPASQVPPPAASVDAPPAPQPTSTRLSGLDGGGLLMLP